jgi:L-threonylcarbamoyladenylate synthase
MDLPAQISHAASLIRRGGIAAFPTETVYGIGANALDAEAVAKIYSLKRRPAQNPLIVHVSSEEQLQAVVEEIPPDAQKLIHRFWPGPLTLIFPKKLVVPDIVTAGLDTVAVRMPAHPTALELIRQAGVPLAAPSANPSGKPSSTHHRHVQDYFGAELFVIEGGDCRIGVESTVLYMDGDPARILRQGGLEQEEIERVLGRPVEGPGEEKQALSPGMMFQHYSPRGQVVLVAYSEQMGEQIRQVLEGELVKGRKAGALVTREYASYVPPGAVGVDLGTMSDLNTVAASLYAGLIEMDQQQVEVIAAQSYPEVGLGKAIMDRLRRASQNVV